MKAKLNYNMIFLFILFFSFLILAVSESKAKNVTPGEEEYLLTAEKMPSPVGGFDGIMKKITYPDTAQRTKTEGKVYVFIYVNENGDVDEVKVVKGIGMVYDEEAVKAIKKTKFTPAMDKGVAVKAKFSLALVFKLS
jgi:protein TonB